jgi:hypothetical protein
MDYIIIIFILFILYFIFIINRKKVNIENFDTNPWITNKDILSLENYPLNKTQKEEVKNMITSITKSTLKSLITSQNPMLIGPIGPRGPKGESSAIYIASGKLVNRSGSFEKNNNDSFNPKYVVTRTEGLNSNSSLAFMDYVSPFASFQNWQLDVNNNIKNRYDDSCLTMNETQDKLYMSKCDENNDYQKWDWDKSNRIISKKASTASKLKCVGLTKPEINVITSNIPDCNEQNCISNTPRKFLTVKDCDINNINEDEIWSFV